VPPPLLRAGRGMIRIQQVTFVSSTWTEVNFVNMLVTIRFLTYATFERQF